MADSYIQLNIGTLGDKVDAEQVTVGANVVKRERDQIAGQAADEVCDVRTPASATASDHGIVTVPHPSGVQSVSGPLTDAQLRASPIDVNQGTPAAVGNAWPIKIVDDAGVNVANVNASGHLESTSIGLIANDSPDTVGNNPVKGGAQARQTNPTAVGDVDLIGTAIRRPTIYTLRLTLIPLSLTLSTGLFLLRANKTHLAWRR